MSAQNQIVQKKVVRLQPEFRRKRQFYNMLLEIVSKKMMTEEKFEEYSRDDIQFFVEQEMEKMTDAEAKSCYQVEFGKIVDGECGDEVYNKTPIFKFVAEACGCEFFPEEAEKIEFECDRNNRNAYCPDCYDGEYDEECANCDCLCSSEYKGYIDEEDVFVCEDCVDDLDVCDECGYSTDCKYIQKDDSLYCFHCDKKENPKSEFKCDNCDEVSCGEAKFFPDDKEKGKKICVLCFDEEEVWFYKCNACNVVADQRNLPKCEEEEYCCECCWKQSDCDCIICVANRPKTELLVGKSEVVEGLTEADRRVLVLKTEPKEPKEQEVMYGGVLNSTLCNVFGGEVVFNKLKVFASKPDEYSDLFVRWKIGEERLSLYVYIDDKPFLDEVYPRNHSCDMFYMLEEMLEAGQCEWSSGFDDE